MDPRPSAYETNELPDCSIPQPPAPPQSTSPSVSVTSLIEPFVASLANSVPAFLLVRSARVRNLEPGWPALLQRVAGTPVLFLPFFPLLLYHLYQSFARPTLPSHAAVSKKPLVSELQDIACIGIPEGRVNP